MKRKIQDISYVKKRNRAPSRNIWYSGENYMVYIRKFDRNFDTVYTPDSLNKTNMSKKSWRNLPILYCNNKKESSINFDYTCSETGEYLVDLLYYDYNYDDTKCSATISLKTNNGEYINQKLDTKMYGDDNNLNRQTQHYTLKKGNKYNIKYDFNKNVAVIGVIIRKFDIYTGTRYNDGDLTIESINGKISDGMTPNEATVKIWYNSNFDDESNLSGYIFDFRDEINIYKKDPTDKDFVQIFGGYISTVNVDDNNLIMTLNSADRLIDGENRYCLQEQVMLGGEKDEAKINQYSKDSYANYDNRASMLDYLTHCYELPLENSNIIEDSYFKKQFPKNYKFTYDKTSAPKTTFVNMLGTQEKNYMTLRNGAERYDDYNSYDDKGNKPQTGIILDCTTLDTPIKINNSPNFYLRYGLGEEEKSVTQKEYKELEAKKKAQDKLNK